METKTRNTDPSTSRRQVLTSFASAIVAGLSGWDGEQNKNIKTPTNTNIPMNTTPAFLTDPGFSLSSLLVNLPCFLNFSDGPTPVILMDTHDYDRLRARVLMEKENEKIQYVGMAYEEFRRRDILRPIDYAKLYPPAVQQRTLRENRAVIEDTPYWVHQKAAVQGAKGLAKYGWGEYQRSFRASLGEDTAAFDSDREGIVQQSKKMDRGRGDPIDWNRHVLNEYVTALEIRRRANQALNLDVQGVIGQGDSELPSRFLNAVSQGNAPNASHIERLDPDTHMIGFNHSAAVQTRKILDHIGEIAADIAGVQHNDWSFLGPTLALPKFKNFDHIQSKIRGMDVETLTTQAEEAIAVLERREEDDQDMNQARYVADWMIEQHDLVGTQTQRQGLTKEVDYAFDLANPTADLRDLGEQGTITRPAVFLAASVMADPTRRYEKDDLYRHASDLLSQLGPPSVTEAQLETYRQRGDYLEGETSEAAPDWFEDSDRQR